MGDHSRLCALLMGFTLMGCSAALAADNGITKEDLKRLAINAYAEEMQMEMEKSVKTELKTALDTTQLEIQDQIIVDDSVVSAPDNGPELSSR